MSDPETNPSQFFIESLTRREREVLRLLAEGLTGPEIAERLTVATSSIKTHIQHLYSKLGVNGKRQAVKRARELGLLKPDPPVAQSVSSLPPIEPPRPKHNLPGQVTRFFGREDEIASLIQRLAEYRLVTLTGSGGVGKTRLSLQAADLLIDQFSGGVWLVELAALADSELVPQHVAAALSVRENPGRSSLENLLAFLRGRQVLLVLDNCEHLLEACARLVEALLRDSRDLKVLASSREPLSISGEAVFGVRSLPFPDPTHLPPLEQLSDYSALRLFVDRARLALPDYEVTEHNAQPLARICQRLDGIPLAIEMAAARINVLSATDLAERLEDAFRVLTGGSRTALPRQQTLRAAMDWSYELLSEAERRLLQRLSVFAGGCTLEAAEAVCSGEELDADEVLDQLASLAAKSMIIIDRRQGEETRYRLLEIVRQYARERLVESKSGETVRRQHLAYFLAFAERAHRGMDVELHSEEWLDRLEAERDNLRAALGWALENNIEAALRFAAHGWLWHSGYRNEGCEWLERALFAEAQERGDKPLLPARGLARANAVLALAPLLWDEKGLEYAIPWFEEGLVLLRELGPTGRSRMARVLLVLAKWAMKHGDHVRAQALKSESLSLLPEGEGDAGRAESLNILAEFARAEGDFPRAQAFLEERVVLLKNLMSTFAITAALYELGELAVLLGDVQKARAMYQESFDIARESGNRLFANMAQSELAHFERRLGHDTQALALYAQTIVVWQELNHPAAVAHQLECIAVIARARSQEYQAARLLGAAEALRESINSHMTDDERVEYDREVSALRAQMAETAFVSAWAEGRAMTMEQAIAEALNDLSV